MKTKITWMLGLVALSLVVEAHLAAGTARAGEVCETVSSCRILQAKIEARLAVLLKGLPSLTDIQKDADGHVLLMDHYDANVYCKKRDQRLPRARELALYAQSLGAEGISQTQKVGYNLVDGSDNAGPDTFYFSRKGYQ